ncbi:hypothetical protein MANES_01G058750v8 [Manihot esculenta]|uniref:Uncharacterized protein n=1 Tax=Manihot esculenta TaxID=3983 RepID=A0ACB7IBA2_MANES|nr:hypothetical protein MANES_01G058750v8 [Manihot esculenta]
MVGFLHGPAYLASNLKSFMGMAAGNSRGKFHRKAATMGNLGKGQSKKENNQKESKQCRFEQVLHKHEAAEKLHRSSHIVPSWKLGKWTKSKVKE